MKICNKLFICLWFLLTQHVINPSTRNEQPSSRPTKKKINPDHEDSNAMKRHPSNQQNLLLEMLHPPTKHDQKKEPPPEYRQS